MKALAGCLLPACLAVLAQSAENISATEARRHHAAERIGELEAAARAHPDSPAALYSLVRGYRLTGQRAKAAAAAEKLMRAAPESAYAHKLMGEAYDAAFQWDRAQQEFQRAIALAPDLPELHFASGLLFWRAGSYAKAAGQFRLERAINPQFARTFFYLADIASRGAQTREATSLLEECLRLDAGQYDALCALAKQYESAGRSEEAIATLRRAAHLKPGDAAAHYRLSRLLRKTGRTEEAHAEERLTRETTESAKYQKTVRESVEIHAGKPD